MVLISFMLDSLLPLENISSVVVWVPSFSNLFAGGRALY
jgi:hypothetical protein